jgi:hypothetical protein
MMTRTIALFTLGLAAILFSATQTEAQPGKGKGGKGGPGGGPDAGASDIQRLERDLNRLLDQIKATQEDLARLKQASEKKSAETSDAKGKGGFEFKGKGGPGMGGFGKGGFGPGGKGKGGFGPMGEKGKLDPETIKERYEYYKKLYEESQREANRGKGKGKGGPRGGQKPDTTPPAKGKGFPGGSGRPDSSSSSSVEARIDRLIRELEQLRSEVRSGSSSGGGKKK